MKIYYNGFDSQEVTFKTASAVLPKKAVSLQSTGEIYYADAGGHFTGIVTSYDNGIASVVTRGYAVATFKNDPPTVGICKLTVGTMGNFEVNEETGKPYTVLGVDISSKTFEFIL